MVGLGNRSRILLLAECDASRLDLRAEWIWSLANVDSFAGKRLDAPAVLQSLALQLHIFQRPLWQLRFWANVLAARLTRKVSPSQLGPDLSLYEC